MDFAFLFDFGEEREFVNDMIILELSYDEKDKSCCGRERDRHFLLKNVDLECVFLWHNLSDVGQSRL